MSHPKPSKLAIAMGLLSVFAAYAFTSDRDFKELVVPENGAKTVQKCNHGLVEGTAIPCAEPASP